MDNERDLNSKLVSSDDTDSNLRTPRDGPRNRDPEESKSIPTRSLRRPLLTRIMPGCRQPDRYAAQYRRSQKVFELYLDATRVQPRVTHEQKSAANYMLSQGKPTKEDNSGYTEKQSAANYMLTQAKTAKEDNSGYTAKMRAANYMLTHGKPAKEDNSGYLEQKSAANIRAEGKPAKEGNSGYPEQKSAATYTHTQRNQAKGDNSVYTEQQSDNDRTTHAIPANGNDLRYIEHQGFFDTVCPGIWDFNMALVEPPRLDIAEQIKLKARLEAETGYSNSSGSYSTEVDTISYEESFHYSDMDMVEDLAEPEKRPRKEGRLMRFFRRIKKALF